MAEPYLAPPLPALPTVACIREALETVYDPCCRERELSVLDMGLIDSIDLDGSLARIAVVLTSSFCPFSGQLLPMMQRAVLEVPGVSQAVVTFTHDVAWTPDRLSARARDTLVSLPSPTLDERSPR